jgi:Asp-tRNA(Asn)/Glu-tRNA(Gln) amidotransferase B subunit
VSELEPVIGLEIHVQLKTRTKMFCGCELSFGDPPNTHTCPVCLGLPGSLPVANARAVHFGLMIGMALESELALRSIFHRKNCRRATRSPSTTSRCVTVAVSAMYGYTGCISRRTRPS